MSIFRSPLHEDEDPDLLGHHRVPSSTTPSTASSRSSAPTPPSTQPRARHRRGCRLAPALHLLSNRLLHLLSSHPATLPDAISLFSSIPSPDLCSCNTLISALSRSPHQLPSARALFDGMPQRDHLFWSAVVSAYARHGQPRAALALYRRMQGEPGNAGADNEFTASSALAAAAAARCHVVRRGIDADLAVVWSALADMHAKCGRVDDARRVFDRMPVRETAMVERYFDGGEGFRLFLRVLRTGGVRPNEFTYAGVLHACAEFAVENLGRQVHGRMAKRSIGDSCFAESALVHTSHMHSKCGGMGSAVRVFEGDGKAGLGIVDGDDLWLSEEWAAGGCIALFRHVLEVWN